MKKLVIILAALFLLSVSAFAATDDAKTKIALDESNQILEQALAKIEELEKENLALKGEKEALNKEILSLDISLVEASEALDENNKILTQAYNRIDKDSIEIENLRKHIKSLIAAGVEVKTYDWNIIITTGYPISMGLDVAYNLPFFPSLGVLVGIDYFIDNKFAAIKAGIKINLGK